MPFITQDKTNWKFLLIVVVLAAIVGGGIFTFQYWWTPKGEVETPEEIAKSLSKEIRNNKDFIAWIDSWRTIKPTYTVNTFTRVDENKFSLNGEMINEEKLGHVMEQINSPYFSEERREHVKIYSPDKMKFIWNVGYPDPLEIDQDVVFFDLFTNKYRYLKTCGTSCWFEKVFWINNSQFVVIRMGEYGFAGEYDHSILFYDLEKNIVTEYKSSEKISSEELEEFKSQDETADWQNYRNEEYGYEIKYPLEWSYTVVSEKQVEFREKGKTYEYEGTDIYAIGIFIYENPNNLTAEQIAEEKKSKAGWPVEIKTLTVDNTDAAQTIDYLQQETIIVKNKKEYNIVTPNLNEDVGEVYEQMLSTFRFLE